MTKLALLGLPIEDGAGRRGCVMGPAAYRTAGLVEELADLGHSVRDLGDVVPDAAPDVAFPPPIKSGAAVAGWTRAIFRAARQLADDDALPIYLGGDHALSLGTVPAHADAAQAAGRPLFVLWLDAHADFNTPATTASGNLHGLPLAHACGLPGFDAFLGRPNPAPVNPAHVAIMGLRSVDGPERDLLRRSGVAVNDMRSIDEHGIAPLLRPFLEQVLAADGLLHVSLDVDFLDPQIAPAVGTTVPGGATFREAHLVMEMLHDSGRVTSLDLVELNPFLDNRGRTARLMVDLTASLFGRQVMDRYTRSY